MFLAACQHFSSAEPVERLLTGTHFPVVVLVKDCLLSVISGNYFQDSCLHFNT